MKIILNAILFICIGMYSLQGLSAADAAEEESSKTFPKTGRIIPPAVVQDRFADFKSKMINSRSAVRRYVTYIRQLDADIGAQALGSVRREELTELRTRALAAKKRHTYYKLNLLTKTPRFLKRKERLNRQSLAFIRGVKVQAQEKWVAAIEKMFPFVNGYISWRKSQFIRELEFEADKGWEAEITGDDVVMDLPDRWEDMAPGALTHEKFSILFKAYIHKKAMARLSEEWEGKFEAEQIRKIEEDRYRSWQLVGAGGAGAPPPPRTIEEIIKSQKQAKIDFFTESADSDEDGAAASSVSGVGVRAVEVKSGRVRQVPKPIGLPVSIGPAVPADSGDVLSESGVGVVAAKSGSMMGMPMPAGVSGVLSEGGDGFGRTIKDDADDVLSEGGGDYGYGGAGVVLSESGRSRRKSSRGHYVRDRASTRSLKDADLSDPEDGVISQSSLSSAPSSGDLASLAEAKPSEAKEKKHRRKSSAFGPRRRPPPRPDAKAARRSTAPPAVSTDAAAAKEKSEALRPLPPKAGSRALPKPSGVSAMAKYGLFAFGSQ